jgi:hypothetical protein
VGKVLIGIGLALVALGLVWTVAPGLLSWFGRLPGDLRIETRSGEVFVPLTSMILVSLALTLIVNLVFRR